MSYFADERHVKPVYVGELARSINPFKDLRALWKIYKVIKRERPLIVHTHTAKAGTLGRTAAILAGVPVRVHTFHGHVFDGYFNGLTARVFIFIERFLGRFTTKIVTVSNSVANDVTLKYNIVPKEKIRVIPLGFDLGRFFRSDENAAGLKKELGLPDDSLLVGIVGRLVPVKNHKMFLDMAKEAGARKTKFIIIGDGELRLELESYAKQIGMERDVIFLGWRRDLENIYAGLDVACLTSLNEGTPVSLIEAMASARPVVSTDVGGVKDIVKDGVNGRLVSSGDTAAFAKAVLDLLNDSGKRAKMGIAGRSFVKINYNKDRLIEDTKNLYEELLKEKGILK